MKIVDLAGGPPYDPDRAVAQPLLDGTNCNARIIRLSPGQALPPHTHGTSELMLYAVEGAAELEVDGARVAFPGGSLALYRGDEELRVANPGAAPVTLLAFLAPPFPPRPTGEGS